MEVVGTGYEFGHNDDYTERVESRIVRLAVLEIYPDQLNSYKAALKEEIEASIRTEPGVLILYAVSVKAHPEQVHLFETYRDAASYQRICSLPISRNANNRHSQS